MTKVVEISVGATYKGVSQEFEQTIDFPPDEENAYTKLTFNQRRLILVFIFLSLSILRKK